MTQSLAVKRMLEEAGHTLVGVFMGENPSRPIPAFVRDALGDILVTYPAPAFVVDARGKGVRPWAPPVAWPSPLRLSPPCRTGASESSRRFCGVRS